MCVCVRVCVYVCEGVYAYAMFEAVYITYHIV